MAELETFLTGLQRQIQRDYDRSVNRDLSRQNWDGVFGRNMQSVMQQTYQNLLTHLAENEVTEVSEADRGQLAELSDGLMQYALQQHRSSCALSNFPAEHNPDKEYIAEVIGQLEQMWQQFQAQLGEVAATTVE